MIHKPKKQCSYAIGISALLFCLTAYAEEIPQTPFNFKPKLDLGLEYKKDFSTIINPAIALGADFKSGTGKKIGFELGYNFKLKEFITESNVIADNKIESTNEIRDFEHVIEASMKSDITTKINIALKGDYTIHRVNTYEQVGDDTDTFTVGPKFSFTGVQYTTLTLGYKYTAENSIHKANTIATDEFAFDTESQRELRGSILVYPYSEYNEFGNAGGTDSFFVGLDDTSFESGEEIPVLKQTHDFELGSAFDVKQPYIPSASLGYNFIPVVDSNKDADDGFGHAFKVGVKEQLWPQAKLGLDYKLGINGYDNQTDTGGEFIKFSYPNTIKVSLSQGIVSWLNASASYQYNYTASNNEASDGKQSHKVNVGLSAFF